MINATARSFRQRRCERQPCNTYHALFANGQANAGARILPLIMEALEDNKDALGILRIEANAITGSVGPHPPDGGQGIMRDRRARIGNSDLQVR